MTGGRGGGGPEIVDRVAETVRRYPLRWSAGGDGDAENEALSRGWFDGVRECARLLSNLASREISTASGFGVEWPVVACAEGTAAPALPVVARKETAVGPDGEYRVDRGGVWREAGGTECLFLASAGTEPAPGSPFDLLWFGDAERYLVRDRRLEIEDLFGLVCVPATSAVLDRLLIHPRRLDAAILSDLPIAATGGPQMVEVRRPEVLSQDGQWRDAMRFLSARADVVRAKSIRDTIEAERHDGATTVFRCDHDANGWSLELRDGRYIFDHIRLERRAASLVVRATLAEGIDALAEGMRARLIFDLRADLVAVG